MFDTVTSMLAEFLMRKKPCIKVMLFQEGDHWIAQGLEIDYAAAGESIDDVKERFIAGLSLTMTAHLEKYNNLKNFVKPAPPHVWQQFYENQPALVPKVRKARTESPIPAFNCLAFMQPAAIPA